jgi:hypothetical protein
MGSEPPKPVEPEKTLKGSFRYYSEQIKENCK